MLKINIYNSECKLDNVDSETDLLLHTNLKYVNHSIMFKYSQNIKYINKIKDSGEIFGPQMNILRRLEYENRGLKSKLYTNLYNRKQKTFPTGLLNRVIKLIPNLELIDHRKKPTLKTIKYVLKKSFPPLRYYQKTSARLVTENLRGIIVAATGTGKTICIAKMIWELGLKTVVITPSKAITDNMVDTLEEYFGSNKVAKLTTKSAKLKDINVVNIQAVVKMKPSLFKDVDALFIDEFHHCFTKNTMISSICSKKRTIESVYTSFKKGRKVCVKSWDGEKFVSKRVTNAFVYKAPASMLKIKVQDEDGKIREIICTKNHKISTPKGYILASDLNLKDKVHLGYITGKEARRRRSVNPDYRKYLSARAKINNKNRSKELLNKISSKMKAKIKSGNFNPYGRGRYGNGGCLTPLQLTLSKELNLETEFVITVKDKERPYHYKLDLANEHLKLGIEVDGSSHQGREVSDKRKEERLEKLGWKIIRIKESASTEELSALKSLYLKMTS